MNKGIVATGSKEATQAGAEILRAGGNAFDAAVAAVFTSMTSEFAGYHGVWYKETYDEDIEIPCFSGGHIHVGGQVDWDTAKEAAAVSIRTLIDYIDQFMILPGDCNGDGEVNILDVVALASVILGNSEFIPSQTTAADMDGNGLLNILDIIAIVNLILG